MKNKKFINIILISSLITLFFFNRCNEYKEPPLINEPTIDYADSPVISEVIPVDSAMAGVRSIVIKGDNFAITGGIETTYVYIGGEPANVRSMTTQEIVVERPTLYGDETAISVMVPRAESVAQKDYKIEIPIEPFGDFQYELYKLTAIEVAENDALYIAGRRKIMHLTSDGINLTEVIEFSGRDFNDISDIKLGPGGYLYILIEDREVYRLNPNIENPEEELYIRLSEDANYFDFDDNDNMYLGDRDGIWVVTPEKTETFTGYHDDITIKQVRVFDGYIYITSTKTIYKNLILDNTGSLGESEVVVDLESLPNYNSADISSFAIDINGMIVLCLKNFPGNSIFVLEDDGSITPYYNLEILPSLVDQLVYGRGRHLYLNRGMTLSGVATTDSVKVYKMGMQYNGAPYLGRE